MSRRLTDQGCEENELRVSERDARGVSRLAPRSGEALLAGDRCNSGSAENGPARSSASRYCTSAATASRPFRNHLLSLGVGARVGRDEDGRWRWFRWLRTRF